MMRRKWENGTCPTTYCYMNGRGNITYAVESLKKKNNVAN